MGATFDELIAEGAEVPVAGWDFSWFVGRASEQRPSWGYSRLLSDRMAEVGSALDIDTGGGEVLAGIPTPPPVLAATEAWLPNVPVARRNLRPLGAQVVAAAESALPFRAQRFDLVTSRHPVNTCWPEISRVLCPGGSYLSQQVGPGSVHELTEAMLGPTPVGLARDPDRIAAGAEAAGLRVRQLRSEALSMEFGDIAAVVHFLRKVIWIVPDFTVGAYRDRLAALHDRIQAEGPFVAHSQRFLIEASKPD